MTGRVLYLRLAKEDYAALQETAEARGESVSTLARNAILRRLAELGVLAEARRKVLGVRD
jgi:predicted transcriptional regulator